MRRDASAAEWSETGNFRRGVIAVADFWGIPVFMPGTFVLSVRVGGVGPMQIPDRVREAVWSVNPDHPPAAIRIQAEILDRYR